MSERKVLDRLTLKDNLGEHVFPLSREVADSQGVSFNRLNAADDALARKTPVVKVVFRPPPPPVACHPWKAALPPLPPTVLPWKAKRQWSPRLSLVSQPALKRQAKRSVPQPPSPPVWRLNASPTSERPKVTKQRTLDVT